MYIVAPSTNDDSMSDISIIHIDCIFHTAHLIPLYGTNFLPHEITLHDSYDVFHAFYINKYADHYAFEVAWKAGLSSSFVLLTVWLFTRTIYTLQHHYLALPIQFIIYTLHQTKLHSLVTLRGPHFIVYVFHQTMLHSSVIPLVVPSHYICTSLGKASFFCNSQVADI